MLFFLRDLKIKSVNLNGKFANNLDDITDKR